MDLRYISSCALSESQIRAQCSSRNRCQEQLSCPLSSIICFLGKDACTLCPCPDHLDAYLLLDNLQLLMLVIRRKLETAAEAVESSGYS